MLEALVDLCRGGTHTDRVIGSRVTSTELVGDILCVKKQPCVWGSQERMDFLIVILQDDDLVFGEVLSYPYAVFDDDEINRSSYRVDLNDFSGDCLDVTKDAGPQAPADADFLTVDDLIYDNSRR